MRYTLIRAVWLILLLAMGGCSQNPPIDATVSRVSRDYEAIGEAKGIRPFVYGKRTLIETSGSSFFGITLKDETGQKIDLKKEGNYYAAPRVLEYFTVSSGGREVSFTLLPPPRPVLPPMSTEPEVPPENVPMTTASAYLSSQDEPLPPARRERPIFKRMQEQLRQYRHLLNKASNDPSITGEQLQTLSRKLDGLETKMANGVAIVHVYFDHRSTVLNTTDDTLQLVLDAAKHADRINIYGRTSAVAAGKNDASIAAHRAAAIEKYLIAHGIPEERVHTTSLREGDFIVTPELREADRFNRRAAIEIIRNFQ